MRWRSNSSVVRGEVFHRRDDAFALYALDVGHSHSRGEVRILAIAFKVACPKGSARCSRSGRVSCRARTPSPPDRSPRPAAARSSSRLTRLRFPPEMRCVTEGARTAPVIAERATPRANTQRAVRHLDRRNAKPRGLRSPSSSHRDSIAPSRPASCVRAGPGRARRRGAWRSGMAAHPDPGLGWPSRDPTRRWHRVSQEGRSCVSFDLSK